MKFFWQITVRILNIFVIFNSRFRTFHLSQLANFRSEKLTKYWNVSSIWAFSSVFFFLHFLSSLLACMHACIQQNQFRGFCEKSALYTSNPYSSPLWHYAPAEQFLRITHVWFVSNANEHWSYAICTAHWK